jgi:RNA polymerase sigma factor (sigma-70 family)
MIQSSSPRVLLDPDRLSVHLPRLNRLATGLCGSREAGEDLVQDTLERVLRSPRRIVGDELPYLMRAVRNSHVDSVRSRTRRVATTAMTETLETVLPAPERTSAVIEAREVLATVADLPKPYRDVVLAVDVAGCSYAEAAEALGVPVGTVMSRLYRGRRRVIEAIDAKAPRGLPPERAGAEPREQAVSGLTDKRHAGGPARRASASSA